jgi:hypothetical protein
LAVKLRQIGGQADVREPRRNAGAERSNRPTRLFDCVPQDVSDFVLHTPSVVLSTSLQPRLDLLFQVTNNELRHQIIPCVNIIDIMISIVCWLFNGLILASGADAVIAKALRLNLGFLSVWTMI